MDTFKVVINAQNTKVIETESTFKKIETKQDLEMRLKIINTQLDKLNVDKKLIEDKLTALKV